MNKLLKSIYWPLWRFFNKYINVCNYYREAKFFIQRGRRGWADCDIWSFDNYNARVVKEAIIQLKIIGNGFPIDMYEFKEYRNATKEEENRASKKWDSILYEIIYAFESQEKISNQDTYLWYQGCEKEYKNLKKNNHNLYKNIHFQTKKEYDRVQNGMKLFVEHYNSLWN